MNSMMTRRALLGTVIGGLVVAPFAMRYFRKKGSNNIELSSGYFEYCQAWESRFNQINFNEKKINGQKEFDAFVDFPNNKKYQLYTLSAQFSSKQPKLSTTTIPEWFGYISGSVVSDKLSSNNLTLQGNKYEYYYPTVAQIKPCGIRTIINNNGNFVFDDKEERFDLSCHSLFPAFYYPYPSNENLFIGKKWENPKGSIYGFSTSNKIVGFSEIANCQTFKIHVTGKNSSLENQRSFGAFTVTTDTSGKETIVDITDQCNLVSTLNATIYVELSTGLVVRHESLLASETKWPSELQAKANASNNQFIYTINQRLG
jgi:hypothetical protein